jgi:hypothetical protein
MTVQVVDDLADAFIPDDTAWRLYQHCFRPVNELAAQRHLMNRAEFDEVMHDKRIRKYLWTDNDGDRRAVTGMSTYTNDLDAWPLVSPAYFRRNWPDHYAARRIWYCGFVGVRGVGTPAFGELVEAMYRVAADDGGIIFLDICGHNAKRGLPDAIERRLEGLAGVVKATPVDVQTFWSYEFPTTVGAA